MTISATSNGSATRWGPLWGSRPEDWALSEDQQRPTYAAALDHVALRSGDRVLDLGSGAGAFLALVSERGGRPFGLDASESLVALAAQRVPQADVRVGDLEHLPYDDDSFDIVTGFNSFFFADDMVAALREARRVAKPGAPVIVQVWGAHEHCDLEAMKAVARPYFPPRPADAPPDPDLSVPGVLEAVVTAAGLAPQTAFEVTWVSEYADAETLARAMVAVAGLALIVGPEREDELKAAIVTGLEPYRTERGAYRFENEYRILVARA